jgi:hypothetical protein
MDWEIKKTEKCSSSVDYRDRKGYAQILLTQVIVYFTLPLLVYFITCSDTLRLVRKKVISGEQRNYWMNIC